LVIGACIACSCAAFAGESSAPDDLFKQQLGLDGYKSIIFKAEDGKEISRAEFDKLMSTGRRMSISKDKATSKAVLAIEPIGPKPQSAPSQKLAIQVGKAMPKAAFVDIAGARHHVGGRSEKPILLNFYFAECLPCIAEIPHLNAFAKANTAVEVLAVTYDSATVAKTFVTKRGLTWPVVADAKSYTNKIGVTSYPTFALVSATGKLIAVRGSLSPSGVGDPKDSTLEDWVRTSLQQ
jgi:thiol-disulfide isomerase/thioredoxin